MNLKKIAAAVISAVALSSTAFAAPTITNLDGNLTPFGGFDWASQGAAFTSGFSGATGSTFTMYYAAWAGNLTSAVSGNLATPKLDSTADGLNTAGKYEYTIFATVTEKVVSCAPAFPGGPTTCFFQVTGGSFDIYYDLANNSKVTNGAWTGFKDGVKIISGSVSAAIPGTFDSFTVGQGLGSVSLNGVVTSQDSAFVNPALLGTNLTSTLQLRNTGSQTNFSVPTAIDTTAVSSGEQVFQADANQTFTQRVPEPAGLALVGLALAGCGLMSRRRKAA